MTLEALGAPDRGRHRLAHASCSRSSPASLIYALYAGDGTGRAGHRRLHHRRPRLSGTTATPLNAWTHLAATYDGTTQRLYVNGVQVATKAVTGSISVSTGALRIGGNGTWSDEWFAGLIDEVRVYNRALTRDRDPGRHGPARQLSSSFATASGVSHIGTWPAPGRATLRTVGGRCAGGDEAVVLGPAERDRHADVLEAR